MYFHEFNFGSKKIDNNTKIYFSVFILNDDGYFQACQKEQRNVGRVNPSKFEKPESSNSKLIFVENDKTALELIDEYGPEHFIICTKNEDFYINNIGNAGSVFIGNYTPESTGDYASGTNHTLPTNGYSKNYSGVNLDSFTKSMTFQKISEKGIQNIGKAIEIMAEAEGLQAHKNAVTLRLNNLKV